MLNDNEIAKIELPLLLQLIVDTNTILKSIIHSSPSTLLTVYVSDSLVTIKYLAIFSSVALRFTM